MLLFHLLLTALLPLTLIFQLTTLSSCASYFFVLTPFAVYPPLIFSPSSISLIMLFQGINTWMCLDAIISFTVTGFLSPGFHHSHSTPTERFHFFVNFVRPQPSVCLWPKIKFPLGNNFPSIWGKVARRILETLKMNGSCFSFHQLNTNYAFLLRVAAIDAHISFSW